MPFLKSVKILCKANLFTNFLNIFSSFVPWISEPSYLEETLSSLKLNVSSPHQMRLSKDIQEQAQWRDFVKQYDICPINSGLSELKGNLMDGLDEVVFSGMSIYWKKLVAEHEDLGGRVGSKAPSSGNEKLDAENAEADGKKVTDDTDSANAAEAVTHEMGDLQLEPR